MLAWEVTISRSGSIFCIQWMERAKKRCVGDSWGQHFLAVSSRGKSSLGRAAGKSEGTELAVLIVVAGMLVFIGGKQGGVRSKETALYYRSNLCLLLGEPDC